MIIIKENKIMNEMIDWFYERTNKHIELVNLYYNKYFDYYGKLPPKKLNHDSSKYVEPELTPYIYISWNYHCKDLGIKFDIDPTMMAKMNQASEHHVRNNPHHPEYWSKNKDRDFIPKKIVIDLILML